MSEGGRGRERMGEETNDVTMCVAVCVGVFIVLFQCEM